MISYEEYKRGNKELQEFGFDLIPVSEIDNKSEVKNMTEENKNKPVNKYRSGQVVLTIWENERDGKLFRSYQLEKSYKDKDDNWQTTSSYGKNDLVNVQSVITSALLGDVKGE